jgi:hypothetical protein
MSCSSVADVLPRWILIERSLPVTCAVRWPFLVKVSGTPLIFPEIWLTISPNCSMPKPRMCSPPVAEFSSVRPRASMSWRRTLVTYSSLRQRMAKSIPNPGSIRVGSIIRWPMP